MAHPRTLSTDTEPAQLIGVKVSAAQRRALQRAAQRKRVTVSQLVRDVLERGGVL